MYKLDEGLTINPFIVQVFDYGFIKVSSDGVSITINGAGVSILHAIGK